MTNNGPIAVIGDTVLQISYSPPFATYYTTAQFSNIVPFGFPRDANIMPNVEIDPLSGEKVEWNGVGGVPLSPKKYRPLAKAASDSLFQYA